MACWTPLLGLPVRLRSALSRGRVKTLGRGLVPNAYAPDGLLEAAHLPGKKFVLGVQWHPESLADRYAEAQALFRAFVEACGA